MKAPARHRLRSTILGILISGALVGCTSTGTGMGESPNGQPTVSFTWQQSSPQSGMLEATVAGPDGAQEHYKGKFYQITRDSDVQTMASVWSPWYSRWRGWPYWGPEPSESFITYYTGQVVANLEGPNGQRMRCHFRLLQSSEGMRGGGQGECQLPTGETIRAEFPPS
jgi:hypothetical protein